jgi:hypothetical protein
MITLMLLLLLHQPCFQALVTYLMTLAHPIPAPALPYLTRSSQAWQQILHSQRSQQPCSGSIA